MKGFTLIELLIVFGVVFILIAVSIHLTVNFYSSQQLDSFACQLVQLLRQAQNQAMAVQDDSLFGVYLANEFFVLFKGENYTDREQEFDFIVELPDNFTFSGPNEIVFAKLSGLPRTTGSINLRYNDKTANISVNEVGRINLE